ncbi:methyl-accepting chemotaxis protein [Thermococcus piezophilus]|uniref:methyl-accepting chemotaxis protein n=1 Tax=Thermococcus piezophilus TaxID=1712654 RepID=UPI000B234631|nr:methyl-accepting chemotaxis protein [Thermococcus piezophilus]
MSRGTTIVAVGSVSLLTLAGTLVSPVVGLVIGVASTIAVSVYLSRIGDETSKILDAIEAMLKGERVDLLKFRAEIATRLNVIGERINILSRKKVETHRDSIPLEISTALQNLEEVKEKLSSTLSSLDVESNVEYDEITNVLDRERSAIAELGDYIQTLTAGIEEMNTQAQALTDYALETANMAETGRRISDNVALNVASINEVNQNMEKAVSILVRHSKRIGEIVEVIGSIAEQTNLLALNAAIEAARSGEHGRGFAVVAENIRELADQSKRSTDQIAELIRNMQESIETVVNSIKQGFKVTEEIKDAVQELIAAFDDIARRANETANMIKELSDSIDSQAQSVQMLMDNINNVQSLQDEVSNNIIPIVESFTEMQSRLNEIRSGLEDIEQSITKSKELLEKVKVTRR